MPRSYTKVRRAKLEARTREKIVQATAALHAEHGTLKTSYAMIAKQAGVSPQTVYNHFPDLGQLINGCTSHVYAQAPQVDEACFGETESTPERLRLLAQAVYEQLSFMAPWLRLGWGEAEVIPELAEIFSRGQAELRKLIAQAVAPAYRATPDFLDAATLLLDYPAWKTFTHGRSAAEAAKLAGECLVALLPSINQA